MNVSFRVLSIVAAVFAISVGSTCQASTVTLSATQDTTIYSNLVNNSGGGHAFGIAGFANNGNERRYLVQFDLTGIAPGSTVNSAQLDLVVEQIGISGGNFELHQVNAAWGEGTQTGNQGGAASAGDATWNASQFGSVNWATPGGTFFTPVLNTTNITSTGTSSFNTSANFVSAIQTIVDNPSQNFGFIISTTDSASAIRIGTREGGNAPSLVVDFTAVPEPTTLPILLLGLVGLSRRRTR